MTTIIRSSFTVTGNLSFSDDVQVAAGATITVSAGATLDLGGHTLLNYGSIVLDGSSSSPSTLSNGAYSTDSTYGSLTSNFGIVDGVNIDGFFSYGSININNTVIKDSSLDALATNNITNSLLLNTIFDVGIELAAVSNTTFVNSLLTNDAWPMGGPATFLSCNFVNNGIAINLDPFFSGEHNISFQDGYLYVPTGQSFEDKVYDWDDDLRISTDISQSTFSDVPYSNNINGFKVANVLVDWYQLGLASINQSGTQIAESFFGTKGGDTIAGGGGNDTYQVNNIGDIVIEIKGQGTDLVKSSITYSLVDTDGAGSNGGNVEKLTLTGTAAINGTGNGLANTLTGNSAANVLKGMAGTDTLIGNGGADKLYGGVGNDVLTGGAGIDKFVFDTTRNASTNVDTIKDFAHGTDRILLDDDFYKVGITGTNAGVALKAGKFCLGTEAQDQYDRIIYDQSTGALYYDPDGTGTGAQVQFAWMGTTTHPELSASDFLVIA